jgi:hypothetical protein
VPVVLLNRRVSGITELPGWRCWPGAVCCSLSGGGGEGDGDGQGGQAYPALVPGVLWSSCPSAVSTVQGDHVTQRDKIKTGKERYELLSITLIPWFRATRATHSHDHTGETSRGGAEAMWVVLRRTAAVIRIVTQLLRRATRSP